MKPRHLIRPVLFAAIIILSAIAIALVVLSPADFTKTSPVYKGF